mmetsp:Transcript_11225/g.17181  ORF Transcript_11225/g.17181 Transcript_11225/m.17181 type:complete len:84 (+) Transcript_11225:338-589(+)
MKKKFTNGMQKLKPISTASNGIGARESNGPNLFKTELAAVGLAPTPCVRKKQGHMGKVQYFIISIGFSGTLGAHPTSLATDIM